MFINPDKFKAFVIDKKRTNYTNEKIQISNEHVQIVSSVKLLGITIDNRLNFNEHISSICKSAANQLNALVRLKTFLGGNERKVLVNSFVLSNFNYCPLVWFVSSSTSIRKIENLHKKALRFLLNNYFSSYEQLLQKSSKASTNFRNHRVFCTEVFKTMLDLNSSYMKEISERSVSNKRPVRKNYKINLVKAKTNQVRYGSKSLRTLAPKFWNSLPVSIKSFENLESFKKLIQVWDGISSKCYICSKMTFGFICMCLFVLVLTVQ